MKCDAKINVDTVLGDKQPFCWCRKQPRASRQSQPPLLINKTAWRQQPAHFPGLHSLYPITPLPFPPSPFPFLLQTPPSASTHLTLRNPIRRTSDWMYGRTVTTKHKLQSHSPPPLSFSCSLSHLLSPSLSLLFSLHRIHPPPLLLSFRLLFLLLLTPSAVSFSSLSSFLVATALAASPYIPHFLPTLPPSLLLLLSEGFKAAQRTLTHSITPLLSCVGKPCQLFWTWTRLHALEMKRWVTNVSRLTRHTWLCPCFKEVLVQIRGVVVLFLQRHADSSWLNEGNSSGVWLWWDSCSLGSCWYGVTICSVCACAYVRATTGHTASVCAACTV